MKSSALLAFTTAALIAAGSAVACPKKEREKQSPAEEGIYEVSVKDAHAKKPCPKKEGSSDEGVYEVADRDGEKKAEEGDRPQRRERGERGERPERRGERGDRGPGAGLRGLDLTEDQQAQVKEIMDGTREARTELMAEVKEAREKGEDINREEIMQKMRAIHEGAMKKIYDDVLTEEQQAKVDKMREEREKRAAEREKNGGGEEGDRPRRRRGGEGEGDRPERRRGGGGDDLDL